MDRGRRIARKVFPAGAVSAAVLLFSLTAAPVRGACLQGETLFSVRSGGGSPLRQPADLAVQGKRLYVLDDLNGRVAVFSLQGAFLFSVSLPGGSAAAYLGLDVGSDGNLYLAASEKGEVTVLTQKGRRLRSLPTRGGERPTEPTAIAVSGGQVFVVDNEAHRIEVFDADGHPSGSWGGLGDGPAKMRYPFRVVRDATGRVIVSDTLNAKIKIFTPSGDPLAEFGTFGVVEGTLYRPAGLAMWGDDLLLVSDNYLGSVQAFDLQGRYEASLCGDDGTPLLFDNPVSLAAGGSTLFVLEMGADRVRAFRLRRKR